MSENLSLFTQAHTKAGVVERPSLRPLAHHGDPASSVAAADELVVSGALQNQIGAVLLALRTHGPCSSAELAGDAGFDRHMVARRLPDLLELGFAEKAGTRLCSWSDRLATVWRMTAMGDRALRLGLPIVKPARAKARGAA